MKSTGRKWAIAMSAVLTGSLLATSGLSASGRPNAATPKSGGILEYAIDATLPGWCFPTALSGGPLGVTRMVYESLVDLDQKGNFIPQLAESWSADAANKVWTFKLRSGVVFSNGEAFNATVAKTNIDYSRGTNLSYLSTGVGVNANINKTEAVDDLTLRVTLDRGDADFIALMYRAGRYVMRAPAQYNNAATCATNGIGTGPFKIASYDPSAISLVRNDKYWRKDANGVQLPYLDGINVTVVKEASQRAAAVRKGTVDAAFFVVGDATFIKDLRSRKSQVTEYQGAVGQWGQWMPNQNKAGSPFKYLNCRLAAAYAVDWKAYNKVRFKGLGTYSGSIVGKGHALYTLDGAPTYNLAKAKEYVGKCNTDLGAAAPFKITLYADTSSQSLNNVKYVQTAMEKAGIQFNSIYQAESAVLIASLYRGGGNLFDFAEGTPAEGPGSGYVVPFFLSKAFPSTATSEVTKLIIPSAKVSVAAAYNTVIALGNHSDTGVDDRVYAAQAETDPAARATKWKAATAYIQSQAIAIPTIHSSMYTFVNKKAKLGGIGAFKAPDGSLAGMKGTKGFEWTGVWKG